MVEGIVVVGAALAVDWPAGALPRLKFWMCPEYLPVNRDSLGNAHMNTMPDIYDLNEHVFTGRLIVDITYSFIVSF